MLHLSAEGADPITAVLTRDWAAAGGWSLFIGLGLFLVVSFFREGIVPGSRYRRLEAQLEKVLEINRDFVEANGKLTDQNGMLITANQITAHFFQETVPVRGGPANDVV